MPSERPKRKPIPEHIKEVVRALQTGLCGCRKHCGAKLPPDGKGLVEYQHDPALALRAIAWHGLDYDPPQHDPRYIFAELKSCHGMETNGSKATSYGSDKHAIAKVRRLRGETKGKPKRKWPSRPFPKRKK